MKFSLFKILSNKIGFYRDRRDNQCKSKTQCELSLIEYSALRDLEEQEVKCDHNEEYSDCNFDCGKHCNQIGQNFPCFTICEKGCFYKKGKI